MSLRNWKRVRLLVGAALLSGLVGVGGVAATAPQELVLPQWWVTAWTPSEVFRFDPGSGTTTAVVATGSGGLSNPRTTILGADDLLYVTSIQTHEVKRYRRDNGRFVDNFVTAASGGLQFPTDLLFDLDGNLLVSGFGNNAILRFSGDDGSFLGFFVAPGTGGLAGPDDMIFGDDGSLLVVSNASHSILAFDGTDGSFVRTVVAPGTGGMVTPHSITIGPDGSLYVPTFGAHDVLRFSQDGAFQGPFVVSGGGGLNNPHGAVFDERGNLHVASFATDSVIRYGRDGAPSGELIGAGDGIVSPIDLFPTNSRAMCALITRVDMSCKKKRVLVKVRTDAPRDSVLVVDNGGVFRMDALNKRGRGRVVYRNQSSRHVVSLPGCPFREVLDCGA